MVVVFTSAANSEKLTELEKKKQDAEKNLGESEILDAALETAEHYYRIGDRVCFSFCLYSGTHAISDNCLVRFERLEPGKRMRLPLKKLFPPVRGSM